MLHIAIIGIITAVLAVLVSSWNNGKNPPNPSNPPKPTPSHPTKPDHPTTPANPAPSIANSIINNPPLLEKGAKGKYELVAAYKTNKIYNPRSSEWDQLVVRGYLTKASLLNKQAARETGIVDELVGPQIRVKQGETLSVNLNNQLPDETPESCHHIEEQDINTPHCFNTTNLHTHGFWVSPQGNSDNIFVRIDPQKNFDYQYKIDPNHPAGTYWYHAHLHGSTAIQVSSGMAGPLIVEGNRVPKVKNGKVTETGDMDILWKDKAKNSYPNEKVLVFQQIQYDCKDASGADLNTNDCGTDGVGVIENYDGLAGFNTWGANNYYTSINGKILGEIQVNQNEFNRWRMIHAGVRDTLGLVIKELPNSQKFTAEQTLEACLNYQGRQNDQASIDEFNKLTSLPVHTIAQDGLTMNHVQIRRLSVFQPGYRHDAMVNFPTTNKYCIFDTRLNLDDEINSTPIPGQPGQIVPQLDPANPANAQLLGWVNVKASKLKEQTAAQFLKEQAQKIGLNKEIQNQLAQLNLSAFVGHSTLMTDAITALVNKRPKQRSVFDLTFGANAKFGYLIDNFDGIYSFGDDYNGPDATHGKYVKKLQIGQVDEWILTSNFATHPYHIHVNPFQIVEIRDPRRNDVSAAVPEDPNAPIDLDDIQYRGLKGQFKDTIFVKPGYEVIVRSHYKKFEGDFVQHCHILDHEDQGMMEYVRICGGEFDCNSPLPDHHGDNHSHH
ncbi:multicopper oxidase family protein [Acinetobacter thermotolerans]|uniref:multicopper oxidase family protein n=1 Tax=Acinetobacter thermotolerans TaxID=3151487 RepID=UPI00325A6800